MPERRAYKSREERISEIRSAIRTGAKTKKQIAEELGVSVNTVKYYLYQLKISIPERRSLIDNIHEIRRIIKRGAKSIEEIAEELELTKKTTARYCYDFHIKIPKKRDKQRSIYNIEKAIQRGAEYVEDIAEITGLSIHTIDKYAREQGIELPPYLMNRKNYWVYRKNKRLDRLIKQGEASLSALARKAGYSRTYIRDYMNYHNLTDEFARASVEFEKK